MPDRISKETRSKIMSSIKSQNTKPEILLRKILFSEGFRYRIHKKDLPGRPDIVLSKYNTVIFVNGCFWHGHNCSIGSGQRKPKSNEEYWNNKIKKNIERDEINREALRKEGWNIITIWECETKDENKMNELLSPLLRLKKDIYRE